MTVEKAYYQLASEGYIIRRTKARYEVADIAFPQKKERPVYRQQEKQETLPPVVYDFGSGDMDMERFPMAVWRKLMSRVLSEPAYLLANQDEQGAPVLRQALSEYVYQSRGVHADPESILIGSGTIPLLAVLTSLLQPDFECIAVEEPGFRLGRELFRSRGFSHAACAGTGRTAGHGYTKTGERRASTPSQPVPSVPYRDGHAGRDAL